jgi:murein DD-endopeptidase MepM/ murein hydrolase activator NlpD
VLGEVRSERAELEEHLDELEKEQQQVTARLASASGAPAAGPVRQGSGALIWPVNGAFTSPFGMRWGRLHAGIDIGAAEGTPIRAADSGTVVLLGFTGGYGNYTCIQHNSSLSTCYAHQSRYGTSMGASVAKGQVIGYVGNTGNSFGAHLHFETRVGGSPVDPMGYL